MKTRNAIAACIAAILGTTACNDATTAPAAEQVAPAAEQPTSAGPRVLPNRFIVTFRPGIRRSASLASDLTRSHQGRLLHTYESVMQGFAAELDADAIEALRNDPDVASIERDQLVQLEGGVQNPVTSWGLDRADQPALPLNSQYRYGPDGTNVHIYIIDTGINASHVDFGGRASLDFTVFNDGRGASDCQGHGTHVAGTAAGTSYGIAKNAKVHSVRVMDCNGSGALSNMIAGLDWVTANHIKPAVANMSISTGASTAFDAAVQNAVNAGVVVVSAAGNNNVDACTRSPARAAASITVSATDQTDGRVSWANFGSCVDIFAPGTGIVSALYSSNTGSTSKSGTSMSAPHVAGAAALYLNSNPSATPTQVWQALKTNASSRVNNPNGSPSLLLNTAFLTGATTPPPANAAPVAQFSASCSRRVCSFNGASSTDDAGITSYTWSFGDGASATGSSTSRTYAVNGTYTVTLTVRDAAGLSNVATKSVSAVDLVPTAAATGNCANLSCSLDATASTDDGSIASYSWVFGDGTTGTGATVSHNYSAAGSFTATVTVTDNVGQKSTKNVTLSATAPAPAPAQPADQAPVASFTAVCETGGTHRCFFDARSSSDDNGTLTYAWVFASAGTARSAYGNKTFPAAGTYNVTLTVTDSAGQATTISKQVTAF